MRSVLVTGASTGIGRATALHLDSAGWRVFAGVRREEDANSLWAARTGALETVMIDVTDGGAITKAREQVEAALGGDPLDGLVNNAGVAVPGPLEVLPLDDFRHQIDVNLTGQVAVTQAFLPLIRRSKAGRILFIASIGGRIAFPYMAPYHASKFAVEAVGDCLRQELAPWGIDVVVIEPGSVATDIWERGDAKGDEVLEGMSPEARELYEDRLKKMQQVMAKLGRKGIDPLDAAKVLETALTTQKPKTRYVVGREAKVQAVMKRVIPDRLFDRIIARETGVG